MDDGRTDEMDGTDRPKDRQDKDKMDRGTDATYRQDKRIDRTDRKTLDKL